MACTNCGGDKRTYLADGDGISFSGAGTLTSPYVPHLAGGAGGAVALEVRDSDTINFTLYGTGLPGDPLVLTGDTSSATRLATLGDVAANPGPDQGRTPMWIGTPGGGHFELRTPGTRYTTHAARGNGLYQGEVIRETDTGDRLEWDGTQWVSIVPSSIAPSALDPSVLQSKGTLDSSTDWNTLVNGSGIYRIGNGVSSSNNAPSGAYGFGTLEVLKSGNSVTQRYNAHQQGAVYTRTKYSDTDWRPWDSFVSGGALQSVANDRANGDNNLQNQINVEATTRSQQDNSLSGRIDSLTSSVDNGRLDSRYLRSTRVDVSGNYSAATGWRAERLTVILVADTFLMIDADMTRTGGTLTGDFANVPIINTAGGYGSSWYQALASGPSNWPHSSYVQGAIIWAASLPANHNLANGDRWSVGGIWVRS